MVRSHTRLLLSALEPADGLEEEFRARMLDLLGSRGDPFSRDHFEPGHFTASAFVLDPLGESIALIDHLKLRRWLQPGGHIEPADVDAIAAARRELAEETGLEQCDLVRVGSDLFDVDVHQIPAIRDEPAHAHFDLRFLFRSDSDSFIAGSDVGGCRWVRIADVPTLETDESVLRALRKIETLRAL